MHELFMHASIPEESQHGLLAILQGLCAMTPVHKHEYRRVYEGPHSLPLSGISKDLSSRRVQNHTLWRELGVQMSKQSYYLTVLHETDFQSTNEKGRIENDSQLFSSDIEEQEGTLLFVDFPDPPGPRFYNSRLAITLYHETNITDFLAKSRYTLATDYLREVHYSYKDNITFTLHQDSKRIQPLASTTKSDFAAAHPKTSDFEVFDAEKKWILVISVEVHDVTKPELVRKAVEQLENAKYNLQGIVEIVPLSRQKLDTRIQIKR